MIAAVISVVAFVLALLLPEVPLRATAAAPGAARGSPVPREAHSLREIKRAITAISGREQRWGLYERAAVRAEVSLTPPALWLLARMGERGPMTPEELAAEVGADPERVAGLAPELVAAGLAEQRGGRVVLSPSGEAAVERIVGVRREGLRELLEGWDPDHEPELRLLLDDLAHSLVHEIPSPARLPAASTAAAPAQS